MMGDWSDLSISSIFPHNYLCLEFVLGIIADLVLLAEVDFVSLFRLGAGEIDSICSNCHAIVHLVARILVELEVETHWRLNRRVHTLLDLLAHLLVVVAGAELLVELGVGWGVEAVNRHHGGSCRLEDVCASRFTTMRKWEKRIS